MKRLVLTLIIAIAAIALTGCKSQGVYSVNSGKADVGAVCFAASSSYDILVDIDGTQYNTSTVKKIAHKSRRDIQNTAKTQIMLAPGRHHVKVIREGKVVYQKEIFLSATETKIIEL